MEVSLTGKTLLVREGRGRGGGGERGEALFPVPMPMCSSQGATVHILSE